MCAGSNSAAHTIQLIFIRSLLLAYIIFFKKKGMNNNIHTCDSCEGSSFTAEELVIVELKVEKTHRLLFLCEECYGKQNSPDEDI